MIDELNILITTKDFHKNTIENTIEALRAPFNNEHSLSEDFLERLKTQWEKKLRKNLERQEKEAKERCNDQKKTLQNAINEQQQASETYRDMHNNGIFPSNHHYTGVRGQPQNYMYGGRMPGNTGYNPQIQYQQQQYRQGQPGSHTHRQPGLPPNVAAAQSNQQSQYGQQSSYNNQSSVPTNSIIRKASNSMPAVPPQFRQHLQQQNSIMMGGGAQHQNPMIMPQHSYMSTSSIQGPPSGPPGSRRPPPLQHTTSLMGGLHPQHQMPRAVSGMSRQPSHDMMGGQYPNQERGQYNDQNRPMHMGRSQMYYPQQYPGMMQQQRGPYLYTRQSKPINQYNSNSNYMQQRPQDASAASSTMVGQRRTHQQMRQTQQQAPSGAPAGASAQRTSGGSNSLSRQQSQRSASGQQRADGGSAGGRQSTTLGLVPPANNKRAKNNNDGDSDDNDDDLFDNEGEQQEKDEKNDDDDLFDKQEEKEEIKVDVQQETKQEDKDSKDESSKKEIVKDERPQIVAQPLKVEEKYVSGAKSEQIEEGSHDAYENSFANNVNQSVRTEPLDRRPPNIDDTIRVDEDGTNNVDVTHQLIDPQNQELDVNNNAADNLGLADQESNSDNGSPTMFEEDSYRDKIYAEHVKVIRNKSKFKIELRNAFMHLNGTDYVVKNITGDLSY